MSKRHDIFVYGTLKRGFYNHDRILGHNEGAEFLGSGLTKPTFTMLDMGPYPGVVEGGETAIKGEVYRVDEATLTRLDALEGHPSFYRRTPITLDGGGEQEVEIYLLQSKRNEANIVQTGVWRK